MYRQNVECADNLVWRGWLTNIHEETSESVRKRATTAGKRCGCRASLVSVERGGGRGVGGTSGDVVVEEDVVVEVAIAVVSMLYLKNIQMLNNKF
tara:strand:- start:71 stop:355 length:285 start_codon:yes stop_codon:yes gene_type:complete